MNFALEELGSGEAMQAASLIKHVHIEDLFRLAHTKIKAVCLQLEKIVKTGWLSQWPSGLNLLDLEWHESVSILLADPPMILRENISGGGENEDLIRTQKDLQQAEELVRTLEGLSSLFTSLLSAKEGTWDDIDSALWQKAQIQSLDTITLGSLVITAAVQKIWQGSWSVMPIPQTQWPQIAHLITADKIQAAISQHYADLFSDDTHLQAAAEYMKAPFKNFKEEMEAGEKDSTIQPHLLPYLLFTDK